MVHAGAKSDAIIQSVDFYPTLLEMVGLKAHEGLAFDGISFVPALRGQSLSREAIFCHFPHYVPIVSTVPSAYVRKGDWKLIRNFCDNDDQSDRLELYNLADDLGETHNLAAKMPEKAKDLKRIARQVPRGQPRRCAGAKSQLPAVAARSAASRGLDFEQGCRRHDQGQPDGDHLHWRRWRSSILAAFRQGRGPSRWDFG